MTTAVPAAARRRRQRYGTAEIQMDYRLREITPGRKRMTVSDRVEEKSFRNTQDWTSGMGISPSGRFQVIEELRPKASLISRQGIRRSAARGILILMTVVLTVILIGEVAALGSGKLAIQRLNTRIASVEEKNEGLRIQLAASGGDISVCTEAVKLNMISSTGARAIQLTAPLGASMTLIEHEADPNLRASAGENGSGQGD